MAIELGPRHTSPGDGKQLVIGNSVNNAIFVICEIVHRLTAYHYATTNKYMHNYIKC